MICGIKGINLFKEYMDLSHSKKTKKLYYPDSSSFRDEAFFDGASSNSSCGCGMVISLNKERYFT